jgi:hypothetical protein
VHGGSRDDHLPALAITLGTDVNHTLLAELDRLARLHRDAPPRPRPSGATAELRSPGEPECPRRDRDRAAWPRPRGLRCHETPIGQLDVAGDHADAPPRPRPSGLRCHGAPSIGQLDVAGDHADAPPRPSGAPSGAPADLRLPAESERARLDRDLAPAPRPLGAGVDPRLRPGEHERPCPEGDRTAVPRRLRIHRHGAPTGQVDTVGVHSDAPCSACASGAGVDPRLRPGEHERPCPEGDRAAVPRAPRRRCNAALVHQGHVLRQDGHTSAPPRLLGVAADAGSPRERQRARPHRDLPRVLISLPAGRDARPPGQLQPAPAGHSPSLPVRRLPRRWDAHFACRCDARQMDAPPRRIECRCPRILARQHDLAPDHREGLP